MYFFSLLKRIKNMRQSYFYVWLCCDLVVIDLRYWTEHTLCCDTEIRAPCKTRVDCQK